MISWLRSHGIKSQIIFTVDNGEEFGGKSWTKIKELRKLIASFGCRLIQNHKGHPEENAHLERSHRTDDDEFYIPRVLKLKNDADLLNEALGYIYYYNNVREHSSLNDKTPFEYLKEQMPEVHDTIRYAQPFLLDSVAVKLGPWSGYNVLAHHLVMRTIQNRQGNFSLLTLCSNDLNHLNSLTSLQGLRILFFPTCFVTVHTLVRKSSKSLL